MWLFAGAVDPRAIPAHALLDDGLAQAHPSVHVTPSPVLRFATGLGLALGAVLGGACRALPELADLPRTPSSAIERDGSTALAQLAGVCGWHEESGFALLDQGADSLDVRLAMVDLAQRSVDAQTYLWHGDRTGKMLLEKLLSAADRGVRVRILIDGFQLEGGLDAAAELAQHPDLSLRVFNPFLEDGAAAHVLELVEDFGRLDHRMHDKLMVADGVLAVTGGRNVGDEYFGLGKEFDFRDLDLALAGPLVDELEASFDEFWNSRYAVPVADLVAGGVPSEAEHLARRSLLARDIDAHPVLTRRRNAGPDVWTPALERLFENMVPGQGRVVRDVLCSASGGLEGGGTTLMAQEVEALNVRSGEELWFATAYLVPDQAFVDHLRQEVQRGVRVRILTNSLASTNQPLAHAAYSRWRRPLLDAGVELRELRTDSAARHGYQSPGSQAARLGLHAKAALFGSDTVLIGSMNLDPRSMRINTELGVIVESKALAARLRQALARDFDSSGSWQVTLSPDGKMHWTSGGETRSRQPALGTWQRVKTWFLGLLHLDGEV